MPSRVLFVSLSACAFFAGSVLAQTAAPKTAEPVTITLGEGTRVFSTTAARGTPVVLHMIPSAKPEEIVKDLNSRRGDFASLAGVRQVIVVGGSAETYAGVVSAAPSELQGSLFFDAGAKADQQLHVSERCKDLGGSPCYALVLLGEDGTEQYRSTGKLAAAHEAFEACSRKVADLTRDKQVTEANLEHGLAIQGYDPVAYIDEQRATAGDKRFESAYRGVTYRFASAAHRDSFNADPAKYVPAYGGWCATAMAKGDKVEIDPKNFKVTGGRLFLFYKGLFGNALNDWKADEKGLTVKADGNWKKLTDSK